MPHGSLLRTVVACVVALDQAGKAAVRARMEVGDRVPIVDGLVDLLRVENRGIAWGLMAGHPLRLPFLTLLALASFVFLLGWHRRLGAHERGAAWGLALVVGGASGNFVDRLLYRTVTDFVELTLPGPIGAVARAVVGTDRWAVFNVADAAITAGLGVLVVATLRAARGGGSTP